MTAEKVQIMKRAMRLVVSSLSSSDRLSIVAFVASSKRLLLLRRMTTNSRLTARRIVDAIVFNQGMSSPSNALKKARKVLENRRERNPVASIMLLSDDRRLCSGEIAVGYQPSCH
ncbi:E3 ubiquitin-protein ligase WAV3 [Camellia lanceoleosa]|uniref:E3 ubiquitin-protein ligase WAV3 n=1 Tax=Camellia lanceoleosa TaxID=1840588 RepID=A0ACC0J090_9ERIC|nr:E3 ubiquitin-protein ligase WAV3 [Camellia lanceoleosa]